jgi:molybdopterin-guanine dinucleotide biosynthesis protein A
MTLPYAVIIAGGTGGRLGGVRKADLRIGGRRLVERVAQAMGAVQPPLLIATGPTDMALDIPAGAMAIRDLEAPVGGPLAGLAAAVETLLEMGIGDGLLLSAAVDTPFLPADFAAALCTGLGDGASACAGWGGQLYPPNAVWRIAALAGLPAAVRSGTAPHSLKALHHALGARLVDWSDRADANPFANLNTLSDLIALGRRA